MELEFEGDLENIEIVDHIIRDMESYDEYEKKVCKPHLQARIRLKKQISDCNYDCSLVYSDESGAFMGLDTGYFYPRNPPTLYPFSTPLNIPKGTKKITVTFSANKETRSPWEFLFGAGILMLLVAFAIWLIDESIGLFVE